MMTIMVGGPLHAELMDIPDGDTFTCFTPTGNTYVGGGMVQFQVFGDVEKHDYTVRIIEILGESVRVAVTDDATDSDTFVAIMTTRGSMQAVVR